VKPPHGPDIVARTWEILRQLYGMTEPQIEVLLAAANTRARLEELTSLWEVRFRRALIQAEDELSAPPTLAEIYANISNEADDHS
jgi:hypothetical protein